MLAIYRRVVLDTHYREERGGAEQSCKLYDRVSVLYWVEGHGDGTRAVLGLGRPGSGHGEAACPDVSGRNS
jgi:hypothetical protein